MPASSGFKSRVPYERKDPLKINELWAENRKQTTRDADPSDYTKQTFSSCVGAEAVARNFGVNTNSG